MVNKSFIIKSLDEAITKHSDFLYNIEGTLREITDSKEEYKTLKDDIWRFWKETKGLNHEELILKGTEGTFFENRDGDSSSVNKTDEMQEFITQATVFDGEKILYTMHNHPSGGCLPSLQDTINLIIVDEKYKVVLSDNGLCIYKNESGEKYLDYDDVVKSYNMMDKKLMRDFDKKYNRRCYELEEEYPSWFDKNSQDYVDYHREYDNLFTECINKNMKSYVDILNEKLHTKSRNVKMTAYYVPRTPRL